MRQILIPIDFTNTSANAFRYAVDMYKEGISFHLIHVTSGLLDLKEQLVVRANMTKEDKLIRDVQDFIRASIDHLEIPKNLSIHIKFGPIVQTINQFIKENNIDEVVIGTRDKYDFFERWIGTISLGLVKRLNIPIYLIPRFAKHNGFNKLFVASDHHLNDSIFIKKIKKWNQSHNAFLKFVHINNGKQQLEKDKIIQELYEEKEAPYGFEICIIENENVTDSLLVSAYDYEADLFVAIPQNRSFIHSLLFKSLSKELILESSIPILFLH